MIRAALLQQQLLCRKLSTARRAGLAEWGPSVQSHSTTSVQEPCGGTALRCDPEMLFDFATLNSSSDSGGLVVFECVMLNRKGHQTVALSFLSSFLALANGDRLTEVE